MMHSTTAHHPLTDAQPVPEQDSPRQLTLQVSIPSMTSHGTEYLCGCFTSADLAVSLPQSLVPLQHSGWQGPRNQKGLDLAETPGSNNRKHQCSYQHCSHIIAKTQHFTSYEEER